MSFWENQDLQLDDELLIDGRLAKVVSLNSSIVGFVWEGENDWASRSWGELDSTATYPNGEIVIDGNQMSINYGNPMTTANVYCMLPLDIIPVTHRACRWRTLNATLIGKVLGSQLVIKLTGLGINIRVEADEVSIEPDNG